MVVDSPQARLTSAELRLADHRLTCTSRKLDGQRRVRGDAADDSSGLRAVNSKFPGQDAFAGIDEINVGQVVIGTGREIRARVE